MTSDENSFAGMPLNKVSSQKSLGMSVTKITPNGANIVSRSMDAVQFSLTLFSTD